MPLPGVAPICRSCNPQRSHRLPNARTHSDIGREMCICTLSNGALTGVLERARVGGLHLILHGALQFCAQQQMH
eukprot:2840920-Pleurochrysis_carterae.AAC.2